MSNFPDDIPSDAVNVDSEAGKSPDPKRHYDSPEDLSEDIELDLATREALLRGWKHDLDQRLEAESEGMSAQDPISAQREAQLSAEARRVSDALARITQDLLQAEAMP